MSSLSNVDVNDCRDCIHRRVFEDGRTYCPMLNIGPSNMPPRGCEFGSSIAFYKIHD